MAQTQLLLVTRHPKVQIINLFSRVCFSIGMALALFSFTVVGAIAFGIHAKVISLTNAEIATLFIGGFLLCLCFIACDVLTLHLMNGVDLKQLNKELNK